MQSKQNDKIDRKDGEGDVEQRNKRRENGDLSRGCCFSRGHTREVSRKRGRVSMETEPTRPPMGEPRRGSGALGAAPTQTPCSSRKRPSRPGHVGTKRLCRGRKHERMSTHHDLPTNLKYLLHQQTHQPCHNRRTHKTDDNRTRWRSDVSLLGVRSFDPRTFEPEFLPCSIYSPFLIFR